MGERVSRGVRPAAGADLSVDVGDMALDGPDAHVQPFGDLAIGLPASKEAQHLHFPCCKTTRIGVPGVRLVLLCSGGYGRFPRCYSFRLVKELIDGARRHLGIAKVGRRRLPLQDSQTYVRYSGGQRASDADWEPGDVASMEHQGRCFQPWEEGRNVKLAHSLQRRTRRLRSDALAQTLRGIA